MSHRTRTAQEVRQDLRDCIRRDISFKEKARDALELGVEYLDVDNGHLTRIDQETGRWEAIVSTDPPDGRFSEGLELDLETTYCRRALETDASVALYDAPAQGWADDPAFETHGLYCYHGTSIDVDGEPYGTVCFVATDPRRQFNDGDTMFVELVARLLERELERTQHETQLTRQTNLALVLNRVLRHNLRNDLSVIRGYTQLMDDKLGKSSYGAIALRRVDRLINLSQTARELDHIVAADHTHESIEITDRVVDVVETVAEDYPNASLSAEYDSEVYAPVLPSFERALEELIENAAKHGGNSPTVTVSVTAVPNAVEIRVEDDGPGLADQEAAVLKTGSETPLMHGSGLGLWLSYWIISSHNGSIDATSTESGTTMSISLPRKHASNMQQQVSKFTRARDQYQAAFKGANDAIVITDDEARIIDANPKASTIYGVENRALLGQPLQRFLPDEFDFEAAWQQFQEAGRDRETVTVVGADGVERQVEYSATTDIVPGQHLVIGRDITDRVQHEQVLKQIETLFQHANDALTLIDVGEEFTVARANPAFEAMTERSNVELHGQTPRDILGEKKGQECERRWQKCIDRREPIEHEMEVEIGGEHRVIEVRIAPVVVGDEVPHLAGVLRDVTDRMTRERRYDAVFNNTYQFMGLLDPDGRVLEANDPALAFIGLTQEDVVGELFWETPWFQHSTEVCEQTREAVRRASEGEFVRKDLTAHGQEQTVCVDFSIRPVIDDTGEVTFLVPEWRSIDVVDGCTEGSQITLGPWG